MVNRIQPTPRSCRCSELSQVIWSLLLGHANQEVDMFARTVSFHLKPGRAGEFTRLLDQNVIPVLRKQKGFQDEISLVAAGGADAVGISVWDLKEDAETYARSAYAGVLKALEPVVEGTPQVQTYEVSNSTFHKIGARATA